MSNLVVNDWMKETGLTCDGHAEIERMDDVEFLPHLKEKLFEFSLFDRRGPQPFNGLAPRQTCAGASVKIPSTRFR